MPSDTPLTPFWYPDSCAQPNCEHFIDWLNSHKQEQLSTTSPQENIDCTCGAVEGQDHNHDCERNRCCNNGFFSEDHECLKMPPQEQRNEKGQFIQGNTVSEGNKGGRPCKLCENKEYYMKIVDSFYARFKKGAEGKAVMPFFEELALDMDVDDETVGLWARKLKKDDAGNLTDELEHPEFSATHSKINTLQKWRLQQRLMGRYNPTGAIKLLEWNHGKMSTSKQLLGGDKSSDPLQIEIIQEGKPLDVE